MSDSQRAAITWTLLDFGVAIGVDILIMTGKAHIVVTSTVEECSVAAIDALPVNLIGTVLVTLFSAYSHFLQKAVLAQEMLLLGLILLLLGSHQNFAVNQTAKVRTLAPMALVERAMVVRVSLRIAKVDVAFLKDALVFQKTLLFAIDQGQFFDFFLEAHQGIQVLTNRF